MRAELAALLLLGACGAQQPPDAALDFPAVPGLDPAAGSGLELARAAVRAEPNAGPAWGRLAMHYHANELLPLALDAYARAERLDPAQPRWPYYAGLVLYRQGLGPAALAAFARAQERSNDVHPPLHWRMGAVWLAAFELERAEGAFQSAIAVAPQDVAGWFGLARVRLLQERPQEAIDLVQRALALEPGASYGHALLADAYRRLKRWDDAQRALASAGDAAPLYRDAWEDELSLLNAESFQSRFQRAATLFEIGKLVESIGPLEALLRDQPHNRTVAKVLAEAYSRTGRAAPAEAAFRDLLAAEPEDRQTLASWVQHCLRGGDHASARAALDTLLRLHPEDGQAHYLAALLAEQEGDPVRALAAYRRSLFHDRRNSGTLLAIGRLELELRHGPEARDAFEQARAAGLAGGELEVSLGQALLLMDDVHGASAALERARASPPADRRALERLAQAVARRAERDG